MDSNTEYNAPNAKKRMTPNIAIKYKFVKTVFMIVKSISISKINPNIIIETKKYRTLYKRESLFITILILVINYFIYILYLYWSDIFHKNFVQSLCKVLSFSKLEKKHSKTLMNKGEY